MNKIDFSGTNNFHADEWPDGTLEYMNQRVFNALFELRRRVDCPLVPSPLFGAHVRHDGGGSRHSKYNGNRLSDATDFFAYDKNKLHNILVAARSIDAIGGLGIYFDTVPSVMFHIDTRPEKLDWIRSEDKYIYLQKTPVAFYKTMAKEFGRLK